MTKSVIVIEGFPGDTLSIVDTNCRVMPKIITLDDKTELNVSWTR